MMSVNGKAMRIGIDIRAISHPQPGGFKSYTSGLVSGLASVDHEDQFVLYADRSCQLPSIADRLNFSIVTLKSPEHLMGMGAMVREQVFLPRAAWQEDFDIFHFPCATGPLLFPRTKVVTIHDAIEFIEKPPLFVNRSIRRWLMSLYSRQVQLRIARQAQLILTDSAYSKADLLKYLRVPEDKIRVIPIACCDHYHPLLDGQMEETRWRLNLPGTFVLAMASASPRKNSLGLLKIYACLPVELRKKFPLLIVWTHSLFQDEMRDHCGKLGLENDVLFLPKVTDQDLVVLYNSASVFVFPSLYEGFGLPVLEAMACGTPVMASDLTSIPEVTGNAAELADPRNIEEFSQALRRILESSQRRLELSQAGLARSAQFSWAVTAQKTLSSYLDAARKTSC
ncbi:MAG TPA: glycosyltransferase family 1 protein [Anaerolineales bacterium]|nr:glycosyltransferase family 1 protein [Anaerolineales bacterium]